GAGMEHGGGPAAIDPATHGRRRQGHHQQAKRIGAGDLRLAAARGPLPGQLQNREAVIQQAPVQALAGAQPPDGATFRRAHAQAQQAALAAGRPLPQPAPQPTVALAGASASPALSVSGGAQHRLGGAPSPSSANRVMQTPVSGSTSSTRAAAAWSPAMPATTERTCS